MTNSLADAAGIKVIERPISFTAQMARAVLDGRKTQTRRIASDAAEACPFGAIGDQLWVREPFAYRAAGEKSEIVYAADLSDRSGLRWQASYLMQRDLSRITLQIVSHRTERLRTITPANAIAEGFDDAENSVQQFARQWDKMFREPPKRFEDNPLVWVIEFELLTPR